jgi:hypothetical protein
MGHISCGCGLYAAKGMASRALLCIVSADGEKAVERQRALLMRALQRLIPHVTDFVEHHFERKSLGLVVGSTAISEFFELVLSSKAEVVVFEARAKLTSETMTRDAVTALLEHAGFTVVFAKSAQKDLSSVEILRALKVALSTEKQYREARIKVGRIQNAAAGGKHGGNPRYGDLPGEKLILDRIQEFASERGLGYTAIAAQLNADGVKPRSAKKWTAAVIANILGVRRDAQLRASRRSKLRPT